MHGRVSRFALSLCVCLLVVCPLRGQTQAMDDLLERARVAQSSGHYTEAAAFYAHATRLSPATPELWSNRGLMEYLAGQLDASAVSLKHALRLNPKLFIPMLFLGKGYLQAGKPGVALPYLDHAHALRPDDPEVLLGLGKANAELHEPLIAQSFYQDAVRVAPQNSGAWFGLGVASLAIIATNGQNLAATQADSIWARALYADELLAQGRPVEATETYKAALAAATPAQSATLRRNLQWLQLHPDLTSLPANSQQALQGLNEGAGEQQTTPCDSAACAYWDEDYQRSEKQTAETLRHSPQDAEALYWSIKSNERIAVAALSRFAELAPQSAANFVMLGDLYRHQRDMESALAEYKKALAIDAHDPPALLGAVVVDLSAGHLEEAATINQAALSDRPSDPQLNLLMAEILTEQKRFSEAKLYLAKCASAPPAMQPRVHLLLGRADQQEGRTSQAIQQFELALPGDEDGSIHYQLSRLYRKDGKLVEAQKTEAEAKVLIKRRYNNAMIAVREETATNP